MHIVGWDYIVNRELSLRFLALEPLPLMLTRSHTVLNVALCFVSSLTAVRLALVYLLEVHHDYYLCRA